jgi:FixJ family two-component response regulator
MSEGIASAYIIDDDPDDLESLTLLVQDMGLNAHAYSSAEAFLDG